MALQPTPIEQSPSLVHTSLLKTTLRPWQDVRKTNNQNQRTLKPRRRRHVDKLSGFWQVFNRKEGLLLER